MLVITKAAMVLLIGIYAIRASDIVFNPALFHPTMLVAASAFVMSLVIFHRPPTEIGTWLYTVLLLCVIGVTANSLRFFCATRNG
jgi:hypothetical protein